MGQGVLPMIRLLVDPTLASESSAALGTLEDEDWFLFVRFCGDSFAIVTFPIFNVRQTMQTWSQNCCNTMPNKQQNWEQNNMRLDSIIVDLRRPWRKRGIYICIYTYECIQTYSYMSGYMYMYCHLYNESVLFSVCATIPWNAALAKDKIQSFCQGPQPTRADTKSTSQEKPTCASTESMLQSWSATVPSICYGLHTTRRLRFLTVPVFVLLCVIFGKSTL